MFYFFTANETFVRFSVKRRYEKAAEEADQFCYVDSTNHNKSIASSNAYKHKPDVPAIQKFLVKLSHLTFNFPSIPNSPVYN